MTARYPTTVARRPAYDQEASAWFDTLAVSDQPNLKLAREINIFISSLKTAGLWAGCSVLCFRAMDNEGQALLDLKRLVLSTKVGLAAPFTQPSFAPGRGFTGNVATQAQLQHTGWNPQIDLAANINLHHLSVYSLTSGQSADASVNDIGTGNWCINCCTSLGNMSARSAESGTQSQANADGKGLFSINRNANNAWRMDKNGVTLGAKTAASSSYSSAVMTELARAGTTITSARQIALSSAGVYRTLAQEAKFVAIVERLLRYQGAIA